MYRLATYQRGARRSGVTIEDGPLGQVDTVRNGASCRVDDHGFHRTLLAFGVEHLVSVVDEDADVGMLRKDQVGCFGRIQHHVGGIHQEQFVSQPGRRYVPHLHMFLLNRDSVSFGLNDAPQVCVLLAEVLFSLAHVPIVGFRILIHLIDEYVRQMNGFSQMVLNGQTRKFMEKLAKASVLVGDIHPAVHTVDGVKPCGRLRAREEVVEGLKCRTVFRVNRARFGGPLFDSSRMMVDALNGAGAGLHPFFANVGGHGHIKEPHVGAFHHLRCRPGIGLRGRDGKHLNSAVLVELAVGEVGSEPAVDAVAMEENGGLKAGFVRHLGNGMEGADYAFGDIRLQFFYIKQRKRAVPLFSFFLYLVDSYCTLLSILFNHILEALGL